MLLLFVSPHLLLLYLKELKIHFFDTRLKETRTGLNYLEQMTELFSDELTL